MLYPKKINSKKIDIFLGILSLSLVIISIILLIINYLTTPNIYWSHVCICGFICTYLLVMYSATASKNISGFVAFQTVLLTIVFHFIDYRLEYSGWSVNIALPIVFILANIAMFIITIINYEDYGKYAINQLIVVFLSLSTIYFIHKEYINNNPLIRISIIISVFNFLVSLFLCHRDFKEQLIRTINI